MPSNILGRPAHRRARPLLAGWTWATRRNRDPSVFATAAAYISAHTLVNAARLATMLALTL